MKRFSFPKCCMSRDQSLSGNMVDPSLGAPLSSRRLKLLGVAFENHLSFTPHIQTIVERAPARLKILKALSGTNWAQQKETITITYKALVWSILTYAAPPWAPIASQDNLRRLQTIQNTALRVATGCHQRTLSAHMHTEPGSFQSKTAWISCADNIWREPSALPINPME